jgi:hypothetical protein
MANMINHLIISMLCSAISKGFLQTAPVVSAIFTVPAIVCGVWFTYEFGSLVIMCLEKYAGV